MEISQTELFWYGLLAASALLAGLGGLVIYVFSPLKNDLAVIESRWVQHESEEGTKINRGGDLRKITITQNMKPEDLRKKALEQIKFIDGMNKRRKEYSLRLLLKAFAFVFFGLFLFSSSYGMYLNATNLAVDSPNIAIFETIRIIHQNSLSSFFLRPEQDLNVVLDNRMTYIPTVLLSWVGTLDIFAFGAFAGKTISFIFFQKWSRTRRRLNSLINQIDDNPEEVEQFLSRKNNDAKDKSKKPDDWWYDRWMSFRHSAKSPIEEIEIILLATSRQTPKG